jgi:tRNA dimethylallyltransferase
VNGHNHVTSHESPVTSHESPVPSSGLSLPRLVIIQGPTATGKSELAVQLAEQFNGEIVGADSLQVYRGMVVGSAAPGPDLTERVPHHLIGITEPDAPFTAADYVREAGLAISGILQRGHIPFVVGGTGLYIRALLGGLIDVPPGNFEIRRELDTWVEREGTEALLRELERVDPETAARLHPNDQVRILRSLEICRITGRPFSHLTREHGFREARYEVLKIGLTCDRVELYRRAEERVDRMLAVGLVDEVQGLLAQGFPPDLKSMSAIGYKEICRYLADDLSLDEATGLIKRDTRRYVKRQQTWFFRDSATKWFEYPENFASIQNSVEKFIVSSL